MPALPVFAGDGGENVGPNISTSWGGDPLTLTLAGSGDMNDFGPGSPVPWEPVKDQITEVWIGPGITSIGAYVFSDMDDLRIVWIPNSVTHIDDEAFRVLESIETIRYGGTWAELEALVDSIDHDSASYACLTMADWETYDRGSNEFILKLDGHDSEGLPYTTIGSETDNQFTINAAISNTFGHMGYIAKENAPYEDYDMDFDGDGVYDMNIHGNAIVPGYDESFFYSITYKALPGGSTGNVMYQPVSAAACADNYSQELPFWHTFGVYISIDISVCDVSLGYTSTAYTGKSKTPAVTIKDGGYKLVKDKDYEVSYSSNKNVGTAKVTIKGIGDYYGTVTKTFKITKGKQTVTAAKSTFTKAYGGSAFSLGAKTNGNGKLTYKSGNTKVATVNSSGKVTPKAVGTAKITVKAASTASYNAGSKTVTIKVKPKKASISKAVPGKKQIKVTMGTKVGATGGTTYQIKYRVKGTSAWKTTTTTAKTKTIKNLKKGKRYQIKVRAYKKVDGKTYYGSWSAVKTTNKVK